MALEIILGVFGFLGGLAFMPLLIYTVGASLPRVVRQPLGWLVMAVGLLPINAVLRQGRDRQYEMVDMDHEDFDDNSSWYRFGFSRIGIAAELAPESFDTAVESTDRDFEALTASDQPHLSDGVLKTKVRRGGSGSWVPERIEEYYDHGTHFLVPIGETLSRFENAANTDLGHSARAAAMKKHGGDTSISAPRIKLMGALLFFVCGVGIGWVFFL